MWNYNCDKCYEREVHSVLKSVTGVADFMLVIPQPSPPSLESPWTNGSGKEANQCSPAKKDFEAGGSILCVPVTKLLSLGSNLPFFASLCAAGAGGPVLPAGRMLALAGEGREVTMRG